MTKEELIENVRLRSRSDGYFFVSLMPVDGKEKPKTVFKSNNESAARNVARQFAKQYKCMIAFEKLVTETNDEENDPGPEEAL